MRFDGKRASGRTTAICEAAKKINAIVVTASWRHAGIINREHGVETISMHSPDQMAGINRPLLWDHFAVECMMSQHEEKIHAKNVEINKLEGIIKRMKAHRENQSSE